MATALYRVTLSTLCQAAHQPHIVAARPTSAPPAAARLVLVSEAKQVCAPVPEHVEKAVTMMRAAHASPTFTLLTAPSTAHHSAVTIGTVWSTRRATPLQASASASAIYSSGTGRLVKYALRVTGACSAACPAPAAATVAVTRTLAAAPASRTSHVASGAVLRVSGALLGTLAWTAVRRM